MYWKDSKILFRKFDSPVNKNRNYFILCTNSADKFLKRRNKIALVISNAVLYWSFSEKSLLIPLRNIPSFIRMYIFLFCFFNKKLLMTQRTFLIRSLSCLYFRLYWAQMGKFIYFHSYQFLGTVMILKFFSKAFL